MFTGKSQGEVRENGAVSGKRAGFVVIAIAEKRSLGKLAYNPNLKKKKEDMMKSLEKWDFVWKNQGKAREFWSPRSVAIMAHANDA